MGKLQTKYIVKAHHLLDSEILLIPHVYAKLSHNSYPNPAQDYARARQFYLKMLEDPSNHSGCYQYVKQQLLQISQVMFPLALVIESSTINNYEQIDICVIVHKPDFNNVDDQCTIQIQRVSDSLQWERICNPGLQIGTQLQKRENLFIQLKRNL